MKNNEILKNESFVDKGLVAMFLKMSPEERLQANDNAVRAIKELRDAYRRKGPTTDSNSRRNIATTTRYGGKWKQEKGPQETIIGYRSLPSRINK